MAEGRCIRCQNLKPTDRMEKCYCEPCQKLASDRVRDERAKLASQSVASNRTVCSQCGDTKEADSFKTCRTCRQIFVISASSSREKKRLEKKALEELATETTELLRQWKSRAETCPDTFGDLRLQTVAVLAKLDSRRQDVPS